MTYATKMVSELRAYKGDIFKELTLPAKGCVESRPFKGSGVVFGSEIVIASLTELALKSGEELTFGLSSSDSPEGDYQPAEIFVSVTGEKKFTAGNEIARFVPNSKTGYFQKLKVSCNADLSHSVITAYLVHKG